MAWYKTGTVSVTNASTTVTGSGTNFVSGAQVGEAFYGPDDDLYEITAISSATSLTITPAYGGSTASGQSYAIVPTQSLVADLASDVADLISDYQTIADEAGAGKFGDGSAASPSIKFTQDQDTGFFRDTANEIGISAGGSKIGSFTANGLEFLDNEKAIFGTGSDLEIFHNGTTSYIRDVGDGDLQIFATDDVYIRGYATNNYMARFNENGAVRLYHNNSEKFETTSTGVDITGTLTSDGLTVDGHIVQTGGDELQNGGTLRLNADYDASGSGNMEFKTKNIKRQQIDNNGDISFYDTSGTSQSLFWDASAESLGIGTSSPSAKIHVARTDASGAYAYFGASSDGGARGLQFTSSDSGIFLGAIHTIDATSGSGQLAFATGGSERLRIDASGNVGIGTSLPKERFEIEGRDSNIRIYGRSGVTNNSISSNLYFDGSWTRDDATNGAVSIELDTRTDTAIKFYTTAATSGFPSEAMRIDSSGNLLVGKTVTGANTAGMAWISNEYLQLANTETGVGDRALLINRQSADGTLIEFRKANSSVGSIGVNSTSGYVSVDSGTGYNVALYREGAPRYVVGNNTFFPHHDNLRDLGASGNRWDDVYATNGTIQTSDENEKQQIASLTDAEITAAKAISKLFKTFKWNDSVAEKGDAARTHTGVIAQDVEQAMTDAGLNAGDYAFFISDTWWETQTEVPAVEADEENGVEAQEAYTRTDTYETAEEAPEGATERNRKGIRYPELLSFVAAATEQRLASIETRLDALEA